jgi:hypothetical protein
MPEAHLPKPFIARVVRILHDTDAVFDKLSIVNASLGVWRWNNLVGLDDDAQHLPLILVTLVIQVPELADKHTIGNRTAICLLLSDDRAPCWLVRFKVRLQGSLRLVFLYR